MIPIAIFAWSCGGGGSGGGSSPQVLTPASLDQNTAEIATVMVMSAGELSGLSDQWIDGVLRSAGPDADPSMAIGTWALEQVRNAFAEGRVVQELDEARAGSDSESGLCDDSGSYRISGSWNGPDQTDDICEISNATITFSFTHCVEFGENLNGSVIVGVTGSLCDPTGVSVSFKNFAYIDNGSGFQFDSTNFKLAISLLAGTVDFPTHTRTTVNGDISANAFDMQFSKYVEDVTVSGSLQTISINGSLTGGCLDGWVTLTTVSPVLIYDYDTCPHGGAIEISGADDVMVPVSFYSDHSMDIGLEHFDSCEDPALPASCN